MQTIKLATDGPDQLVRLPDGFRFEGDEVNIRRDAETGDVILSAQKGNLDRFFELLDELTQEERDEFVIPSRDRTPVRVPDLF